jgi:hypothetical protein
MRIWAKNPPGTCRDPTAQRCAGLEPGTTLTEFRGYEYPLLTSSPGVMTRHPRPFQWSTAAPTAQASVGEIATVARSPLSVPILGTASRCQLALAACTGRAGKWTASRPTGLSPSSNAVVSKTEGSVWWPWFWDIASSGSSPSRRACSHADASTCLIDSS